MTDIMETCSPTQLPVTEFDIGDRVLIRHRVTPDACVVTVGTITARIFRDTGTVTVRYLVDTAPVNYTAHMRPDSFAANDLEHYHGRFV